MKKYIATIILLLGTAFAAMAQQEVTLGISSRKARTVVAVLIEKVVADTLIQMLGLELQHCPFIDSTAF